MKELKLRRTNLASNSNDAEERREGEPRRGIMIYIEYQSVCPFVGIGSPPPPFPVSECVSPLDPKGGGATLPCG
jgi:hypothetical protein